MTTSSASSQSGKVWFITGVSSGFGKLLAEYLVTLGANVVATARKPETLKELVDSAPEQVQALKLDVTRPEEVDAAVKEAIARWGRIDVLVNNAGYGLTAAVEEATPEEYRTLFETNVFGLIHTTQAFLPQFRKQRHGNIVMLSSIAGLVPSAGWGFYNASKFAVEGLSEALAGEMKPLGVSVTVIEPGPFRTEFLGTSGRLAQHSIADYSETAHKMREYMEKQNGRQPGDPQKAVEAIVAAVEAEQPPLHLLLGKLAYDRYEARTKRFQDEVELWKETTLGADFPA
ncbi:MAG: oxidoreductase [Acidobacteriaceae bacterium]|nr:oxidoreductase [Acidobacteriaceae bacterium]